MTSTATLCRCGHSHCAHQHYRAGSDCCLCRCPAYRRRWFSALTRALRAAHKPQLRCP